VFKNSTFYRGEWLRGQVHGKGEMVQHGNTYTGNFANDLKVPPRSHIHTIGLRVLWLTK